MQLFYLSNMIGLLMIAPFVSGAGHLRSRNSTQVGNMLSGALGGLEDASSASDSEVALSDSEQQYLEGTTVTASDYADEETPADFTADVQGMGDEETSPGDVQNLADAAESQADNTAAATEVMEDLDPEADVEANLEAASFFQSFGEEKPRKKTVAFAQESGADSDDQDADDKSDDADSEAENNEAEDTGDSESENAAASLSHPADQSDVALYSNSVNVPPAVDTSGSEAGSDMALYGNSGASDSAAADAETDYSEGSEATTSLIQTLRRHEALHGLRDFDDEDAEYDAFEGESEEDDAETSESDDDEEEDDAEVDHAEDGTFEVEDEDGESSDDSDDEDDADVNSSEGDDLEFEDTPDEEHEENTESVHPQEDEDIEEQVNDQEDEGMQDAMATENEAGGPNDEAAVEEEERLQDESESLTASES